MNNIYYAVQESYRLANGIVLTSLIGMVIVSFILDIGVMIKCKTPNRICMQDFAVNLLVVISVFFMRVLLTMVGYGIAVEPLTLPIVIVIGKGIVEKLNQLGFVGFEKFVSLLSHIKLEK